MSILTDFFIATPDELNNLSTEQLTRDRFPTFETNNVDSSKIEMLARLVVENVQRDMMVLTAGAAGQNFVSIDGWNKEDLASFEQWIERFDPVFVECLASFPTEQMPHVATQWAAQWEKFNGYPAGTYSAESLVDLMRQLCDLAKQACAEQKQMYLWTRL